MGQKILSFAIVLFLSLFRSSAWALAPIESLILGNFAENYSENDSDPLNYVFSKDNSKDSKANKEKNQSSSVAYKRELALYRGFYEEGKNISHYCKSTREIHYRTEWEKVQVMRSMLAEIQYIGLDMSARAIPQYAKALEFTREEYLNLIDGLVGNYCSANLAVISKKELRNNLLVKFDKENNFKLPSISGNPFFPDNIDSSLPSKTVLEQEFKYTVKLFQSICSWGGNPNNPGLLAPILKNPALMSFFIRQMNNEVIDWKESDNSLFFKEDRNTVQVWCDNLICRKMAHDNFNNKVYYSVGGTRISEDLKRLYCEEFRTLDDKTGDSASYDERITKIMNSRTADEENFINSQFIALLTGVPDFFLRLDKFNQGKDLFRSSIDFTWNHWARSQIETLNRELYFEEPLTLELVERSLYFNPQKEEMRVSFDVNLGEFDRSNQRTGKVRVSFKVFIQRSFLHYYREALKNLDPRNVSQKEHLLKRFRVQLTNDVNLAREKFIVPPWKGDLESLIASELTDQLLLISDRNFAKIPTLGFEPVNVELNYGLFALKYINHQKNIQNAKAKNSEQISQ